VLVYLLRLRVRPHCCELPLIPLQQVACSPHLVPGTFMEARPTLEAPAD